MSPRARNGANSRREMGVSSDTTGRAVLPALVSEERTLFRGGRVDSSSSISTVIGAIVPDIRDSKDFLSLVYGLHNTSSEQHCNSGPHQTMGPLHPRLLVISFLVAILTVGEYCPWIPTYRLLSYGSSRHLPISS